MRVAKWGNSLAVRLPAALVEELGVKEGDELSLTSKGEGVVEVARTAAGNDPIASLRKYRGLVPAGYKFKREDAYDEE